MITRKRSGFVKRGLSAFAAAITLGVTAPADGQSGYPFTIEFVTEYGETDSGNAWERDLLLRYMQEPEPPVPNTAGKAWSMSDFDQTCRTGLTAINVRLCKLVKGVAVNYQEYARFDDEGSGQLWMKNVRRHMDRRACSTGPVCVLESMLDSYDDYDFRYTFVPQGERYHNRIYAADWNRPSYLLKNRVGNCVSGAMLTAATFNELGYKSIVVLGHRHIISGVVVEDRFAEQVKGRTITLPSKAGDIDIIPMDTTPHLGRGIYSAKTALHAGKIFTQFLISDGRITVADLSEGEIIFGARNYNPYIQSGYEMFLSPPEDEGQ